MPNCILAQQTHHARQAAHGRKEGARLGTRPETERCSTAQAGNIDNAGLADLFRFRMRRKHDLVRCPGRRGGTRASAVDTAICARGRGRWCGSGGGRGCWGLAAALGLVLIEHQALDLAIAAVRDNVRIGDVCPCHRAVLRHGPRPIGCVVLALPFIAVPAPLIFPRVGWPFACFGTREPLDGGGGCCCCCRCRWRVGVRRGFGTGFGGWITPAATGPACACCMGRQAGARQQR